MSDFRVGRLCLRCHRPLDPGTPTASCYDGCDDEGIEERPVPCYRCQRDRGTGERCQHCDYPVSA